MVTQRFIAFCLFLLPWATAQATPIHPSLNTALCLDIAGGSSTSGTPIQVANCHGNSAQDWSSVNGTLQALGKCLDVQAGNTANGTAVLLNDCSGTVGQQWSYLQGQLLWDGGTHKCLDVTNGNASDGQHMQIWDCAANNANQQWQTSLQVAGIASSNPSSNSTTTFQPHLNLGLCIDVAGGAATNGANIQLAHCNGGKAQVWTLKDGTMQSLGKCLDNTNNTATNGAQLQLNDCQANDGAQQWTWTGNNLQLSGTNKCIDVPNGQAMDGQKLQLWDCGGNNTNQIFVQNSASNINTASGTTGTTPPPVSPPSSTATPPGGRAMRFINQCSQTIWVALQNNGGKAIPSPSGFTLQAGMQGSVGLPAQWGGRLWGRTGCQGQGNTAVCASGDCGGVLACNGAGGQPTSVIEFQFDGWNGPTATQDYYDISLVDAFNLPVAINPVGGTGVCHAPKCSVDILTECPTDLQVKDATGNVVVCLSSCTKYQTDETCCRGAHNTSATCPAPPGAKIFKQACPDAYSYAYDDGTSTWNCTAPSGYTITFCP